MRKCSRFDETRRAQWSWLIFSMCAWLSNSANWVCQRVAFAELCHTQAQQVAPNPRPGRFSTETPLERERRLQIQHEQRRRRRQQETTEQKEHRLAQWRQRQQEAEEQEIGIRGIMIVLDCRKPRFLSLPVSLQIYRSKSAKFQLCITAGRIIIFRQTAPGNICSCFCLFLNPDAEIMPNLLFNTLLTITPFNTQKRRRRKERTTYGPLRRYSQLVTHPVHNPDRQGLTWVPLPNQVSRGLLRDITYFYIVKKLFSSTAIVSY